MGYLNLKCELLVKSFKENNIHIDKITIDESKNDRGLFYVSFWYNNKLVDYSYKMERQSIEHYLNGISKVYTYEWKNNHGRSV